MEKPQILSEEEIGQRLESLHGWRFEDNKLIKEFSFDNFTDGTCFLCELAPFCDKIDHHPDVKAGYRKIEFSLQRYDVGGKVTDRDFEVVEEIEKRYRER